MCCWLSNTDSTFTRSPSGEWGERKSDREKWSRSCSCAANLVKSTENTSAGVRWLNTLMGWVRIFTSGERTLGRSEKTGLLSPPMINQRTLRARKVIHKKKKASASMVGCHGTISCYLAYALALMWNDLCTINANWLPWNQVRVTVGFTTFQSLKTGASILPRFNLKPFQAVLAFQSAFFKAGSSCCNCRWEPQEKQPLSSTDINHSTSGFMTGLLKKRKKN